MTGGTRSRVGVLVVAYNAESTLANVLDRLPAGFRARVDHVVVCDDASSDATHFVALGYQTLSDLPLTIIRHERNLGYGGNQKAGYNWAIANGLDIIVLLHGDGQYQPEVIERLVEPLEAGGADAVFGSRMLTKGGARRGGMPVYKFVGNKILTAAENRLAGLQLSEWHSGYRAYLIDALKDINFEGFSDGFDFDTQIILALHEAGKTIREVPIPTYYGDEICRVNGLKYARDVVTHASKFHLKSMGFGGGLESVDHDYALKVGDESSHAKIVHLLSRRRPGRVLDLGCSGGLLAKEIRTLGHTVTGVDVVAIDGVLDNVDRFVEADLNAPLPADLGGPFDTILVADVLEHLVRPDALLQSLHDHLSPGGVVVVSVPNFSHWYPRTRVAFGAFDYDRRGILDAGHVRFFTRRSFTRTARRSGFEIRRRTPVGLPWTVLQNGSARGRAMRALSAAERVAATTLPGLFAYQYVFELKPALDLSPRSG